MADNPLSASSPKPNAQSGDYAAMNGYWTTVSAILGGADAMRAGGEKFLPKFPMETQDDYEFRRKTAKFTNVFRDIVENLTAKPFSEEMGVVDGTASGRIVDFIEDIDGRGSHLHSFAQETFFNGITYAIDWILVDYTKGIPNDATIAQEKAAGARPYWVHIPAQKLLAIYSDSVNGVEVFTHARLCEDAVLRNGYGETKVERVRVFNREPLLNQNQDVTGYGPATWELFEKQHINGQTEDVWVSIEQGRVSIGIIPLVPFLTGRRKGASWQVIPSMQDAADLQIELYQQESGLKYAKESTAFPMLSGDGVAPQMGPDNQPLPIPAGPKAVLYAPPQGEGGRGVGSWKFIEPAATSLKFLADDVKETINQLRELGRQPLTAQTGNLTVITTAFAAQKGNSAIQAWALNLKDALENAFKITVMWLKETQEPEVQINTDFALDMDDDKGIDALLAMRYPTKPGQSPDLSQRTFWHEMRRRGVLSPEFDADDEDENIIDELASDVSDDPKESGMLALPPVDPNNPVPPVVPQDDKAPPAKIAA